MTRYEDRIRQVGDQWVAALGQAEEIVVALAQGVQQSAVGHRLTELSAPIARLVGPLRESLPTPAEVVEAGFAFNERLLGAQRSLTLRLLEVADGGTAH